MEQHELITRPKEPLHQPHLTSPSSSPVQNTLPTSPSGQLADSHSTSRKLFIIIGSLYLGTFLVALDTTIIGTALPAITSEFHALDDLAWYGSAYLLTLTALQPTLGKLYKVLDTKILYLACIAVFESALSSPNYVETC